MKHSIGKIIVYLLSLISIYLIFLLLNYSFKNNLVFPHPNIILKDFIHILGNSNIYYILLLEIIKLVTIVFISFLVAIILVYLSYRFKMFKTFISPYISIFRSIPIVIIISILMVILGLNLAPYIMTILVIIPISYEVMLNALNDIPKEIRDSYLLESKRNIKIFTTMEVPLIKEDIKSATVNSIGLGFKVMIMAEFICYTPNSFGSIIINSANNLEYSRLYAFSIFIIIIVILFEYLYKYINKHWL